MDEKHTKIRTIRLTAAEDAALAAYMKRTGINSASNVIRIALRALIEPTVRRAPETKGVPSYETRKQLREATLRVGREKK